MTFAHLTFALGITAYILMAIYFEERDPMQFLGQDYADYRKNVPMLIPRVSSRTESPGPCEMATVTGHTASLEDSTVSLRQPVGNIEAPRS